MESLRRTGARRPALPGGDDGSVLILTALAAGLVFMSLASIALLSSRVGLVVTHRRHQERQGFYAAEGGVMRALALLEDADPPLLDKGAFLPPWPVRALGEQRGTFDGWEMKWVISTLEDGDDMDGDIATPIALFNRSFGYSSSPFETGGYPLFQIRLLASRNSFRRGVTAMAAPLSYRPDPPAALTAGGKLSLEGEIALAGGCPEGEECADDEPGVPAVAAAGDFSAGAGVSLAGEVLILSADELLAPLDIVNPGEILKDLSSLPSPEVGSEEIRGIFNVTEGITTPLEGEGILVVHNPLFDPLRFEASRLAAEEGIYSEAFDVEYSHLDAANAPALLETWTGGHYRGLIVADALGFFEGETEITGAVVLLGQSPAHVNPGGSFSVTYSREALRDAGRGAVSHLVGFRYIPDPGSDFP